MYRQQRRHRNHGHGAGPGAGNGERQHHHLRGHRRPALRLHGQPGADHDRNHAVVRQRQRRHGGVHLRQQLHLGHRCDLRRHSRPVVKIDSNTLITAIAPPHAVGNNVPVVVSTFGALSAANFDYVAASAPAVTNLSASSGPVTGGTQVTMVGTDFNGATAVAFGSTAADWFVVNSDTSITAEAPAAAATGTVDVTVTTYSGTSTAVSADQFTYNAVSAPTVSSVTAATTVTTQGGVAETISGAISRMPAKWTSAGHRRVITRSLGWNADHRPGRRQTMPAPATSR